MVNGVKMYKVHQSNHSGIEIAEFVKTLEILDVNGKKIQSCSGSRDNSIIYEVGEYTFPDSYDPDPRIECSNGIHFFLTKQEAIEWLL